MGQLLSSDKRSRVCSSNFSGSARLTIENLEDRRLMAVLAGRLPPPILRVDPVVAWIDQNIQDASLRSIVKQLEADRVLSRTEMMTVFNTAAFDGVVTGTEFNDLQDIVSRPDLLGTPEYVQNLANKVVNGSPANAHFGEEVFGNLASGSAGTQLTRLTSKWFRGLDRPELPTPAQIDMTPGETLTYKPVGGTLFAAAGPEFCDIRQGMLGDCSFLAAIGEAARVSEDLVRNMFIDNGDNTYTVRFFRGSTPDYLTVDRYLPVASTGIMVFANGGGDWYGAADNVLWPALAEKAYAQLNESGWGAADGNDSEYLALDGLWPEGPLSQVTGRSVGGFALPEGAATVLGSAIGNDFLAGHMVLFTSDDQGVASNIVTNHVYAMIGYDSVTGMFMLGNPWGPDALVNNHPAGTVTLSAQSLFANFSWCTETDPSQAVTTIDTILHTQQLPVVWDPYISDILPNVIDYTAPYLRTTSIANLNVIRGMAGPRTASPTLASATAVKDAALEVLADESLAGAAASYHSQIWEAEDAPGLPSISRRSEASSNVMDDLFAELAPLAA